MKYSLIAFLLFSLNSMAATVLGVGAHGGLHTPVADNEYYRARLSKSNFLFGAHLEYRPFTNWAFQLSHTRYEFKESPVSPVVTDLLAKYRLSVEEKGSLYMGLGAGAATFHNKKPSELHMAIRGKFGSEFVLRTNLTLDVGLNLVWIKEHGDEDASDIILLSPQAGLTWFFI